MPRRKLATRPMRKPLIRTPPTPLVAKVDLPAPVAPEQVAVEVVGKTLRIRIMDWLRRQ
jgi:hypothetical protein